MSHPISPRVSFYDGQNINEEDLDVEQTAWHSTVSNSTEIFAGSGIEQEFASQRVLFDSYAAPAEITSLIDAQNFDGEPIYEEDSFGNTVFLQPSDSSEGNQLDIEISDANLIGSASLKIFIFGTIFGGGFVQEAFTFNDNTSKITTNYYTRIVSIMSQDFRGNQNTLIDGYASRNVGGRLRILEALPMRLARDAIMVEQASEPNQDYKNFKPATLFKTLDILLDEIAAAASLDKDDLGINLTSTAQRTLDPNTTGVIIGQKFKARTNNIQKVSILLSVEERPLATPGEEFDWSGDIVVGIRKLQTTVTCPVDTIPGAAIDFDPEPSALAEVSFDKNGLEDLGVSLTDEPQVVEFIFTQSLLANPSIEPVLVEGEYYILTIRRAGNVSVGTIVLEEAANTTPSGETDETRMTVFAQNIWTDVPESDLWFKVYTNAVRVVNGTAIDGGIIIRSPKIKKNAITGVEEPYVEGGLNLIDVSSTGTNYAIVQASNSFSEPESHPSSGNKVFSRISDVPSFSIISEDTLTTLLDAGNETIVLGLAVDTNPVGNPTITGTTQYPGLQWANRFTVINPSSDITANNLVGSILIPNTDKPSKKYRIIKQELFTDLYGDVDGDGDVDADDILRAQVIGNITGGDGYSTDLQTGAVSTTQQQAGVLTSRSVTMEEILRADVDASGLVDLTDISRIQLNVSNGTAFPAGTSFTRAVLTVEDLTNPLNVTPNIPANDTTFNAVPFSSLTFRVDFVPLWSDENIEITDLRRFVSQSFTSIESSDITGTTKNGGENVFFVPDDLILTGDLLNSSGSVYPIDLEINNVIIELPEGSTQGEVDVFTSFVRDQMVFADGTTVDSSALGDNQVRVTAAVQSIVKDTDGYDFQSIDGYAAIEETVAILYTQSSGILRIRADNIRNIGTRPELRTKIVLTVYLKKGGFKNTEQTVSGDSLSDFLTAI